MFLSTEALMSDACAQQASVSRRFFVSPGRKQLVETLAFGRDLDQERRRFEALAVFRFKLAALLNESLRAHHVDIAERAARIGRKTEAQNRADVGLAHVGEHMFLKATRRLQRLDAEQALLELVDVDRIRSKFLRLQVGEAGPQPLRTALRIIIE